MNTQVKQLRRIPAEGTIAGVCAGLAAYFDVDVTLVRFAWAVLSIVPGGIIGGLIAYIVAAAIMPAEAAAAAVPRRLRRSNTDAKVGGVCGGIAEYLDVDSTLVRLAWVVLTIIPGAIVLGVVAYLAAWFIMPASTAPTMFSTAVST